MSDLEKGNTLNRRSKKKSAELKEKNKNKPALSTEDREKLFNELQGVAENMAVNASFAGARALQKFCGGEDENYWKLILVLDNQVKAVNSGDLKAIEGVLTAQIHILNNIFNKLALRAVSQDYVKLVDSYMRLALKAQSQCRVTAETLANMKNPFQSAFVKQANIGYNQQVNNGSDLSEKN